MPPSGALPNAIASDPTDDGRIYWVAPLTGKAAVTMGVRLLKLAGPLLKGANRALGEASALSYEVAISVIAESLAEFVTNLDADTVWALSEEFAKRTTVQYPDAPVAIPLRATEWDARLDAWRDWLRFCCEVNQFARFFTVKSADGTTWTLARVKAILFSGVSPGGPKASIGISGASAYPSTSDTPPPAT